MAYDIIFTPRAWKDYIYWQGEDPKTLKRINKLIQELQRDGAVQGLGKTEMLRYTAQMSKRIDKRNRLIYSIEGNQVTIISCLNHYDDT